MPFKSKAQQGWMFKNKPKMAKEWAAKTPKIKSLPQKVKTPKVKLPKVGMGNRTKWVDSVK
jgi:hypothetical protein